jgi:hypothetical protein
MGGVCSTADCREFPGRADCDHDGASCEVDLRSDVEHCGQCDNACQFDPDRLPRAAAGCEDGVCTPVCEPGWGDCDFEYANGCETSLRTLDDCGACGKTCALDGAAAICRTGRCEVQKCEPDFADCDGDGQSCETELDTNEHCGACDTPCEIANATTACRGAVGARACALVSCEAGWADCDGRIENGCEHNARSVDKGGYGPCVPDSGCTRAEYGNHVYFICSRPRSWDDARETCQQQAGGDLAVLDQTGEADFLRKYVSTRHWVGHTDRNASGIWSFVSGLEFWSAGLFLLPTAGWGFGEPNPFGDCGALYATGLLGALVCSQREPFVCEVGPSE